MVKFLLKKIFCVLFVYSGICRLFSFIHRNDVKILLYHGIINGDLPLGLNNDGLHIQLKSFERQMRYLRKRYRILSLSSLIECLKEGKAFPKYGVVLTFDDGYKNNYENLRGLLSKCKVPITIFLVTDYIDTPELLWPDKLEMAFFRTQKKSTSSVQAAGIEPIDWNNDQEKMKKYVILKNRLKKIPHEKLQDVLSRLFLELATDTKEDSQHNAIDTTYTILMNWDEVQDLSQYGVQFGSHTCSHQILTNLSNTDMRGTLKRSFLKIKDHCGNVDVPFAYPNGSFNGETKKAVVDSGYSCALTTVHGFNEARCDLYALKRNEIGNRGDIHIFIATLSGVFDFIKSFIGKR